MQVPTMLRFKLLDQLFILINSLFCCIHADNTLKKVIVSGRDLAKIKYAPPLHKHPYLLLNLN